MISNFFMSGKFQHVKDIPKQDNTVVIFSLEGLEVVSSGKQGEYFKKFSDKQVELGGRIGVNEYNDRCYPQFYLEFVREVK